MNKRKKKRRKKKSAKNNKRIFLFIAEMVILAILLVAFIALMIYGNKLQKKSQAAQENIKNYIESGKLDSYHLFNIANDQIAKGNYDMAIECINLALKLEKVPNKQILMKTQINLTNFNIYLFSSVLINFSKISFSLILQHLFLS